MANGKPGKLAVEKAREAMQIRAKSMIDSGMSIRATAKELGVSATTVTRWATPQAQEIATSDPVTVATAEQLKTRDIDALRRVRGMISTSLEANPAAMVPSNPADVRNLVVSMACLIDKERLVAGQTTANVGVLAKVQIQALGNVIEDYGASVPSPEEEK